MSFLKNIFGKKETPIRTYADFWNWFESNQEAFYKVVKSRENLEKDFFDKLSPKLGELKDGFYFLTGMSGDHTTELIITPDGIVKNIVFAEELVAAAPAISNWKFTALKSATNIDNLGIRMGDYNFDSESLSFYAINHDAYPDEIDIVIVHNDYKEEDQSTIINGVYIFLDNYLGELNSVTAIDNLKIVSNEQAESELIPISKLKDYLIWREKEFVERYSEVHYDTANDSYSALEAELNNGRPWLAIMNTTLLNWDNKASHPWILAVEIKYDGNNNNGMPDKETYEQLNVFEDEVLAELRDFDGYLNVGRQTADNVRVIYFACKDFRKPAKTLYALTKKYAATLDVTYSLYKDKYWQSFERFRTA